MITTLGLLAALIVLPLALKFGVRLFALVFLRTAFVKGAEDIGRKAVEKQPDRVHLLRRGPQVWAQPDDAGALATPLLENGFDDAGTFAVNEMPGVFVRLLCDSRNGMMGVVYEHPRAGHWVELTTRYTNGDSASFTTTRPTGLRPLPGHAILHAPGVDAGALLHRALTERPKGATKPVNSGTAVQLFEECYAECIARRKKQGVGAKEVVQVAASRAA